MFEMKLEKAHGFSEVQSHPSPAGRQPGPPTTTPPPPTTTTATATPTHTDTLISKAYSAS
jgi:hypothetical protein